MKNYYQILNIKPTASSDEIERSYRVLSKRYSPDVVKRDERAAARFADINEAYATLSNNFKRSAYDRQFSAGAPVQQSRPEYRTAAQSTVQKPAAEPVRHTAASQTAAERQAASARAAAERQAAAAERQASAVKAQADAQAAQLKAQLAATEKRAHDAGVAEGKRELQQQVNALNTELRNLKAENAKLQSKVDGMAKVEQELSDRDREYNSEKRRASELEKQLQMLKANSVSRADLGAVNAELRNAKAENAKLMRQLAAAERAKTDSENKLAASASAGSTSAAGDRRAVELQKQIQELRRTTVPKTTYDAAKAAKDKLESENAELRNKLRAAEAEARRAANASANQAAGSDKEVAELNARVERLESDRAMLMDKLRQLGGELNDAKARAEEAERVAAELSARAQESFDEPENEQNDEGAQYNYAHEDYAADEQTEKPAAEADEFGAERIDIDKDEFAAEKIDMDDDEFGAEKIDLGEDEFGAEKIDEDNGYVAEDVNAEDDGFVAEEANAEDNGYVAENIGAYEDGFVAEGQPFDGGAQSFGGDEYNGDAQTFGEETQVIDGGADGFDGEAQAFESDAQEIEIGGEEAEEQPEIAVESEQDIREKIDALTFDAEAGDGDSQNELGEIYLYGKGVEKDDARAVYWFKEGAKQKHPDCTYNLGLCFVNGIGVEPNPKGGLGFIKQAIKLGSQKAKKNKKGKLDI